MNRKQQEYKSKARLVKRSKETEEEERSPEELLQEIKELKKENKELKSELSKLKAPQLIDKNISVKKENKKPEGGVDLSGYNTSWTWLNKLLFVLKRADKPLQSKEILSLLESADKTVKFFEDKQKALSVHLNKAVKYERIKHYKLRGSGGFFYCLPEWFDEKENLKNNYTQLINI